MHQQERLPSYQNSQFHDSSIAFDHASETPSAKLELSIAARNLVDADIITVSDPMCVVYTRSPVGQKWVELGRTEIIWNNLNPQWVKKFKIDYYKKVLSF